MVKQFLVSSLLPFLGVLAPWRLAPLLAQVDAFQLLTLAMTAIDTLAGVVMGIILYKVSSTVGRFNRQEDKSDAEKKDLQEKADAKIKELSEAQHQTVTKLIDERFRAMSHEVTNVAQGLMNTIAEMKNRLEVGDGEFDKLGETAHSLELKANGRIESLKEWMYENAAMKQDLEKHEAAVGRKFDHLEVRVSDMGREVAVLADRARPKGARE